jgi:predicted transcriptional regulator
VIDRGRVGGPGGGSTPSVGDRQAEDGFQDALGRSRVAPASPQSPGQRRAAPATQQRGERQPDQPRTPVLPRGPAQAYQRPSASLQSPPAARTPAPPDGPTSGERADDKAGRFSSLGDRLVDLRRTLGITQVEVAKRMGSTQPAMARIEKGEMKPNLRTLRRYGEAIGQRVQVEFKPQAAGKSLGDGALERVPIDAVPEALAQVRRKLGLTQAQVAAAMDTSQPVIARLESGEAFPNLRTLERYCEALSIDPVITFDAIDPTDDQA